jgi:hypothetical protein
MADMVVEGKNADLTVFMGFVMIFDVLVKM